MKKILLFCSLLILVFSCTKEEGLGGNCTLTGKLYVVNYNSSGILVNEYYGPDERVFIVYGDDEIYADEMRTHYDGTFRFDHLYPGTYTVFAYSECDSCDVPDVPVMKTIEFTGNKETIETEDIIVRR